MGRLYSGVMLLPFALEPAGAAALSACTIVDRQTDAAEIVRHAFRVAQLDGREPFVETVALDGSVEPPSLLPAGFTVIRNARSGAGEVALARSSNAGILLNRSAQTTVVSISAESQAALSELVQAVRSLLPASDTPGTVPIRTWFLGPNEQPRSHDRKILAPAWTEIQSNYSALVRGGIEQMMTAHRPYGRGKLILWHGSSGTGKTTAIRSLVRAWQSWCSAHYIADPERLFSSPGYISEVLTRPPAAGSEASLQSSQDGLGAWKLLIAEDSDEYLRATARRDAGAALGRLLNLGDGLLGQGVNALILITTNEELHRLHPALIRPGRCFAQIEFTPMSVREARSWMPDGLAKPEVPLSLAELFEIRGQDGRIRTSNDSSEQVGTYL